MLFEKIKGHKEILSIISKEIIEDTFEGVYLFHGPASVGKHTIARMIGRYLNCTGLIEDNCRCENCRLYPNVPDFLEISKGNGMITVGDIAPMSEFLSLETYRGRSRVIVIDNAHNLNHVASNNLLKILEEIPHRSVIILITDQLDKLSETVRSRCYHINFKSISFEEIKEILKNLGYDSSLISDMGHILPYIKGNILLDFNKYVQYIKFVPQFLKNMIESSEDDLIAEMEEISYRGDVRYFLEIFILFLNDLLKLRYGSPDVVASIRNVDYLEDLTNVWKEDVCVYLLNRIRSIFNNLNKRINLKEGHLFIPVIMWGYYFIQKEKKK